MKLPLPEEFCQEFDPGNLVIHPKLSCVLILKPKSLFAIVLEYIFLIHTCYVVLLPPQIYVVCMI